MKKFFYLGITFLVLGAFFFIFFNNSPYSFFKNQFKAKVPFDAVAVSAKCRNEKGQNESLGQMQCWSDLINSVLKDYGVDAAMDILAYSYDNNSSPGSTCHALTHKIGTTAYELFAAHKEFKISPKTAYCSYGFYHGFMEALVSRTGDAKEARRFCEDVDKQLSAQAPDAFLQCYHGIGHGWANNHNKKIATEHDIGDPALKLCKAVAVNPDQLSRCATGVFNAIAIDYMSGEYGFPLNKNDPLQFCRGQEDIYKDPCYISMNTLLMSLTEADLIKSAKFLETIKEDGYASHAMINLAAAYTTFHMQDNDQPYHFHLCRSVQNRLHGPCIQGYAFGFMENGEPHNEYVKPLEFCQADWLNEKEKAACQEYIFSYLRQWYPKDKNEQICGTVKEQYRALCYEKINQK